MLTILPLGLTACSELIGSVEPPKLAPPPIELTESCTRPVLLPERTLKQKEVENFWIRDRASLIECNQYKNLLKEYYTNRDDAISGDHHE
jgi:hypothetical protein